jgi:hypothetical protein
MTRIQRTALTFALLFSLFVGSATAQVRIAEFLVVNTNGILDQDSSPQPWVEIWNTNRVSAQSLASWRLTDGTTQWVFPAVTIPPNDRLVVFLSGKNRIVATAPLHTSFTPNPAGGLLQLQSSAGTPVSSVDYPAQTADVSFGTDPVQPTLTGFYADPTPGAPNNFTGAGVSGKVLFSEDSRAFTGTMSVALSLETPATGAEIRYTIDGSNPQSTSTLYAGAPISVATTRQIRARVFEPGKLPGEIEAECYLQLDASTQNFSSGMPLIVLTNFGAGTPVDGSGNPPDNPGYMWVWEPNPADGRSRFTSPPTLHTRVGMDRRGSSTLGNPKFNLNVETRRDRAEEEKDVVLLGMPAHSDWVFSAPYNFDRSLIHNPLMFAMSNTINRYAPRTRNAEMFIDVNGGSLAFTGGASGDYFGVYNIMEKIRRGADRVDIAKLDAYDNDPVKRTGGYIIKVDRRDTGDNGFTTPRESLLSYYYPKEVDLITNQRDPQEQFIRSYMTAFDNSVYSANFRDPVNGYRRYLDVGAAVDHHLMNVWSFNVDALRLSGYMTIERGGKIQYGPIWDFDRALASTDGRDANPLVWRSQVSDMGTDFFNYTWWNRLFQDPDFYQAYIDRWVELRRAEFSRSSVEALIDSLNNSITAEAVQRDVARWGQTKRSGTGNFPPFTNYPGTQAGEIQRMKDWLQARANFMDSQWVRPVTISAGSGRVTPGTTITMSAPAGTIYYTLDGSDPRPPGGAVPTASNVFVYSGPITINDTTRVRARAYNPTHTALTGANNPPIVSRWSGRTDARYSVDPAAAVGGLVVTELNYHPANPTAAELLINPMFSDASFEYIEVKNVGTATVDLANAAFTMGVTFTFGGENAISLEPGQHAIIAANPAAFAARYGARPNVVGPFQGDLSNAGERLLIVAEDGSKILDFTYDDAWYPATDGPGKALVVYAEGAPEEAFSTAANWRESLGLLGSPGADEAPFVTTVAATEITATTVELNAIVSPNGLAAQPDFVLADQRVAADAIPAGNANPVPVSRVVTGLLPHTEYTFRAEATNAVGSRVGTNLTFTTLNRPPQITDKMIHFASRNPGVVNVLANDLDPDGDVLAIVELTQPSNGTVALVENQLIYTPGPGATGNDTFTYTVADGFGGEASATVTLFNNAPVVVDDVISTDGTPVIFDPRLNDSDVDGDQLQVESVSAPASGTAVITGAGTIQYTPSPTFLGTDTFTYQVTDGAISVTAQVEVRSSALVLRLGTTKNSPVPGESPGVVYSKLDPADWSDLSSGEIRSGKTKTRAVFDADGSVLLKVGDPAPLVPGAKIASFGQPHGHAVLAKLKGGSPANSTVLYAGVGTDELSIAAQTGTTVGSGLSLGKILSFDGKGTTVFFRAKLSGGSVSKSNDIALGSWSKADGLSVLVREGDVVGGRPVLKLGTLFSTPKTTAEQRWRIDDGTVGVRLTFAGDQHALFAIPAAAANSTEWVPWASTGGSITDVGTPITIGVPGFGPDGVAFAAQLASGPGVFTSNDAVVLRATDDVVQIAAREGDPVPDLTGAPLPRAIFQSFLDPVAGGDGKAAFIATLAGATVSKTTNSGVFYFDDAGALKMIARLGDPAPGGGRWASFDSLVLPNGPACSPIFVGKLAISPAESVTKTSNLGLWALNGTGAMQLILRTGKTLTVDGLTKTVKSFTALKANLGSAGAGTGFDDARHVAALVKFTDGTQAVVRIGLP